MKKVLSGSIFIVVFLSFLLSGCRQKSTKTTVVQETSYTCPMHPQIIRDEPGACPICGMDLVPMDAHDGHAGADDSLASLVKPVDELVISNIRTIKPEAGSRFAQSSVSGVINYNTNTQNSISARISGRVERLYVKFNYQPVSRGQKLLEIYSPDLVNAQQELLFLASNGEPGLLESAKRKLRLLGMNDKQITTLLKTRKIDYSVTIFSPYSGYVSENVNPAAMSTKSSVAGSTVISSLSSGGSSMGSMGASGSPSQPAVPAPTSIPAVQANTPLQLREGQYVSAGQKLFNVINSNSVWAEFYVHPDDLAKYKKGTMISVQSPADPKKRDRVPVSLIQPYYKEGTSYPLVRATLANPGQLWKVGELINVTSDNTRVEGTWLPRTAVLQLGRRNVAFIKENGSFTPVYVKVNAVAGNWVETGNSISIDQEVAENAWFLVDSESFIKVKEVKEP